MECNGSLFSTMTPRHHLPSLFCCVYPDPPRYGASFSSSSSSWDSSWDSSSYCSSSTALWLVHLTLWNRGCVFVLVSVDLILGPWTAKAASFTKVILQSVVSSHFHAISVSKLISVNIPFMTISGREGIGGPYSVSLWFPSLSASRGPLKSSIERLESYTEWMLTFSDGHRRMRYDYDRCRTTNRAVACALCESAISNPLEYGLCSVQCDGECAANLGEPVIRWLAQETGTYSGDSGRCSISKILRHKEPLTQSLDVWCWFNVYSDLISLSLFMGMLTKPPLLALILCHDSIYLNASCSN